jgi:protein TonB
MTARAVHLLDDDRGHEFRRWSLAALVVLAAHAGLMGTYLLFRPDLPAGAPEAPAILIDLSPLPSAPESAKDAEIGPTVDEAAPPPEPQVMEMQQPEPVIEPPPPLPMESPVVLAPEPPKPQEIEKPREIEKPKEPPKPEAKKVEHKKPVPRSTSAPRAERSGETAAANAGASGAAIAEWRSMVVSKLQAAKRYPSGAESRREQGVVTLSFTLSRSGAVLARSIARSSGYPELDQEVLAMVQRAAPFPPFPAGMGQASQQLTAPVRFSLR